MRMSSTEGSAVELKRHKALCEGHAVELLHQQKQRHEKTIPRACRAPSSYSQQKPREARAVDIERQEESLVTPVSLISGDASRPSRVQSRAHRGTRNSVHFLTTPRNTFASLCSSIQTYEYACCAPAQPRPNDALQ